MKISIFGLGYVGAVSLACLVRDGHSVIGVDIDPHKLDLIRAGKTPVVEEGMVELMAAVATSGRAHVTDNVAEALQGSDVSLVCVGTPAAANGSQDQGPVLRLADELALALRHKRAPHAIVFRSTLVPGTVEDVLRPRMQALSGKRDGLDFHLCFQPEFLREGSAIRDYDHPPLTVVGASSAAPVAQLRALFGHLACRFVVTGLRTAEMLKVSCNNFHALKITFANETARLCAALGVDAFAVLELLCQDTQLNISSAYLRPGFAFGGSCLPKDLRATTHLARMHDVELPMLSAILPSNRLHLELALSRLLATGKRRMGFVGLSFKSGTDDLRESPLVSLAEQLIGRGISLSIYDPEVHLARLLGANLGFIEARLPHIGCMLQSDLQTVIAGSEVLVLGMGGAAVEQVLLAHCRHDQTVLDLVHPGPLPGLRARLEGLCW
jgi:GDP-mannose 6-dehydrogenase